MNKPSNSLSPADFASEEQIARNLERIRRIGDRGQTFELFEDERQAARAEVERQQAEDSAKRARGDDLPLFAA